MVTPNDVKLFKSAFRHHASLEAITENIADKRHVRRFDVCSRARDDDPTGYFGLVPHLVVYDDTTALYLPLDRAVLKKIKAEFEKETRLTKRLACGGVAFDNDGRKITA